MHVTPIGLILILVGPLLMLFRPKWLYIATIFSLPFTATGVVNVGSGLDASAVQVPMFLGALLILRVLFSSLWKMSIPLPRNGKICLLWLGVFLGVATLSLVMPVLLDSHVRIPSSQLLNTSASTLIHLKSKNITGLLYVVFGYIFAYLIAVINQKPIVLRITLKAFLAGSVFAALWAILEFICKITGIPYPGMIFNTGTALSAMGYIERLRGFPRLSSVAVEPSIFAQILLIAISLYLPFIFGSLTLFGKTLDRWLFALLLVMLCLSTSSTGYVGLLIMGFTVFLLLAIRGVLKLRYFVVPMVGLGIAALIYAVSPTAQQVLDSTVFTKSEGYSAFERFMTIHNAFEMFREYPILGIGWSSIDSYDLIVNLLSNAGILGLLSFVVAMYSMFRLLYRSIKSRKRSLGLEGLLQIDFAVYIALAVILGTCMISGILYVFTFFWFILGLTMAAGSMQTLHADIHDPELHSSPAQPAPGT